MKHAKVSYATRLSHMQNEERGKNPVIKVVTDLPKGCNNAFYIDLVDLQKAPLKLAFDHPPKEGPNNPDEISFGDDITFDERSGFKTVVTWNGRRIRQKGHSFDEYDPFD